MKSDSYHYIINFFLLSHLFTVEKIESYPYLHMPKENECGKDN